MAALANGGRLVHPHLLNSVSAAQAGSLDSAQANPDVAQLAPPRSIEGLSERTLAVVGESLHRVVADPQGTAHETVYLDEVSIAGKTGTAQVGPGLPDHAWFAAYCPADAPKVAIVVALEHAGDGSQAAGPLARQIVQQMRQLGYFRSRLSKSR
jgi:penicillin-binding protein 2